MTFHGGKRTRRPPRGGTIAALDVGTTKICCVVGKVDEGGQIRLTGVGHQLSRGLRAGTVVDMEAAEQAIGTAVHAAERMAGETIHDVVVNISGGQPTSQLLHAKVPIGGHEVCDGDLRRALGQARQFLGSPEDELIHSIPVGYAIDGNRGIRDPRGMFGEELAIQLHVVTAGSGAVRNLATCIARCHLDIESFVASPYAAGLSSLVEDEMELGVTLIDMGGGTTTMAVFSEGQVMWTDCVPVGGSHVTNDIARGLTTPLAYAERMKILYGNAANSVTDEREIIDVPQVGEDEPVHTHPVPKSLLVQIIRPRLEEIFELARERLETSGLGKLAGRRVVLTGGASQLPGTRDLAQSILEKQVRLGRPQRIGGLADSSGPAFSTAAGLLAYAVQHQADLPAPGPGSEQPRSVWGRVGLWLKENL